MKEQTKKMWREHGMLLGITSAVILMQMLVGVLLWNRLPETIATHFDFHNEPNGWSSRPFAVFGMPLLLLGLHWMCILLSGLPGFVKPEASPKLQRLLLLVIPAVSLLVTVMIYGYALGAAFNIARIVWVFVGVIFAAVGNYLPKIRRNAFTGIRLPWTLMDDEVWNRTHRFSGPVWVVGGLLMIVCGLIGTGPAIPVAAIVGVIAMPMVYSLIVGMKKSKQA